MGSVVSKLNALPSVKDGSWEPLDALLNLQKKGTKVESVEAWILSKNLTWQDCVYMGDDRTDWECMQLAGLTVAPGNALPYIKDSADIVVEKAGGAGAIREFTDMVLRARGRNEWEFPAA
jgi:3-deoxy-D-manno-octulosonate 8-phosphate phosphatase KdsC-like HAD superfamily phosphatase